MVFSISLFLRYMYECIFKFFKFVFKLSSHTRILRKTVSSMVNVKKRIWLSPMGTNIVWFVLLYCRCGMLFCYAKYFCSGYTKTLIVIKMNKCMHLVFFVVIFFSIVLLLLLMKTYSYLNNWQIVVPKYWKI